MNDFEIRCVNPRLQGLCERPSSIEIPLTLQYCTSDLGPQTTTGVRTTVSTLTIPASFLATDGTHIKIEVAATVAGGGAMTTREIYATINNGFSNPVLLSDLISYGNQAGDGSSYSFELNLLRRDSTTLINRVMSGSVAGAITAADGATLVYTGGDFTSDLVIGFDMASAAGTITLEYARICVVSPI